MIKRQKLIKEGILRFQNLSCTCDNCKRLIPSGTRYFELYLDHRVNHDDDSFQYCSKECLVEGVNWLVNPMFLEDDWGRVNYIISVEEFKGEDK